MNKKLFTLLLALVAIATTAQAQNTNGHEYVDLGLPSGTLWATCNVGASKPEEYGNHFAWGETSPKEDYIWDTYQWYDNGYTKYNGSDGKTELDLEDDAANAKWGGDWQMPSLDQMKELVNQCTWEWETLNGAYGRRITGPNGNSIFLPAAGWRSGTSLNDAGTGGGYWSRMRSTIYSNGAYHMQLGTNEEDWDYYSGRRSDGQVVRAVVMKKQNTTLLLNAENFPDANFRAALATILGISEGDEITAEKIAATTTLNVSSRSIANLTGIEHFTALIRLYCYDNQLTSLDVSGCTALTELLCYNNQLTALDVSKNTALVQFGCHNNQLTALDVSKNTALEQFRCSGNQLTTLDVSKNTTLTGLNCSNNQLTLLDVSKNTALTRLDCYENQLTALGVSKNTALKNLVCYNNQLTSLDVSKNTALTELGCWSNQLTSLDVSNNSALTRLSCERNQLTSLDVSKNTALTELYCGGNQLTLLDVSKNTALTRLDCYENQLTALGVSKNTALKNLVCYNNQLTALDVSKNTALTALVCFSNQIKGAAMDALVASLPTVTKGNFFVIDMKDENEGNACTKSQVAVAKEKGWTVYDYNDNNRQEYEGSDPVATKLLLNAENFPDANFRAALASILGISEGDEITAEKIAATTSLDVSKPLNTPAEEKIADLTGIEHFTALTYLSCFDNQLTSLDVSKNTALTTLDCSNNQLTSLDVSKNTALKYLYCFDNQLTSLDVSGCTALTDLDCNYNQLTALDVSKNTILKQLLCNNNQLTSLDVSKNTILKQLLCDNNQLTSLNVSGCTALKSLYCYNNHIKGEAMDALVASLPTVSQGYFYVINTKDENEGNVCTKSQVTVAKGKGWKVYDYDIEYEGSDDATAKLLLNAENFPDANFRAALTSILGISEGDEITAEKIAATTSLDVSKSYKTPDEAKIADLTGIEHFTALTKLYCDYNNLTTLDVSKNVKLEYLSCRKIPLASLDLSKNTELLELLLWSNQLTELDLSNNTKLEKLEFGNFANVDFPKNEVSSLNLSKNTALRTMNFQMLGLTSLDVSKNTALTKLYCYNNQLTSLDVSQNTALTNLRCDRNQLTALDVSNNIALTYLDCYSNQIKGEAMDALVASLPTVENGEFHVINTKDKNEGNICTKAQVAVAKGKGWTVYDFNGSYSNRQEYEGSDPVEEDIDPVDEDDNIDFGTDMNEGDDLNGNVIGDIYYNINTGNGGYNAAEGCIVVKKPTDDGTVNNLEGKDIFGEDFKSQFTGIVFKVPAGKGTIKVNAETTGNMMLKVKIGSNDPVEMELNGKLKVTFPYNVSETTYVYIYAGAANEAKGFGAPASGDAALKIYGIEFIRDNTPTDINSVDSGELTVDSWYTIDGKKLAGEPKEKGIYIRNGRKVVK